MKISAAVLSTLFCALIYSPASSEADDGPTAIPLTKLEYPGNPQNIHMLYVNIISLGNRKIDQPILLDTGSSGMTIECLSALPAELCSEDGIKITESREFDGILVTTKKVVMHYGTYDEYGNVASARVTFGSPVSSASTDRRVSFLIRYKQVRRDTGEIVGGPLWPKGIFGISPIGGDGPNQMIRSPMAAVSVGTVLHRGYYLSPIGSTWKPCTNEQGNCPEVRALHIGVPDDVKKTFKMQKWKQANPRYNFPTFESCLSWNSKPNCRPTLYDTGNSTIMVPTDTSKPYRSLDAGTKVAVKTEGQDDWNFTTTYKPEVEIVPGLEHNIVGIRFFERNSLLVDLETQEIGLRLGH
ncbi:MULTISPECIES: hypothetical protein [unclassified Mesorhizobium]|uniref:hypothetical protein n=1 Tax=unclassified Mesorhizobium TaxID=325217 RepID=UPI0010924B03|nr:MULTISPECIES: hypothetical protein [unclassified Mesorhizobium]TGP95832.1 hypothetical protein EN861_13195 [Mesorhizobium sp. M8A.F.Ca.ET.218.01.1.1]TGT18885.1 hypothetical protein EN856_13210 [Mesorhizobium sp. M8A.F.Ca.ET.213.01.1.1]TIS84244.1 MAG: hypothetical protein E5W88_28495 [Mesorhizobium sp.]